MKTTSLYLKVNANSLAEANRLATELEGLLKREGAVSSTARVKEDAETMDAGTVLVAMLAAPAVVELAKGPVLELAKGLADWLRKRRVTLSIGADGAVGAENVRPEDVERVLREVLRVQGRNS